MGAFNEIILDSGERIQFKFGVRWQYEYRIGEMIEFSEGQIGSIGKFEVSGISGKPKAWRHYAVTFVDGVITNIREVTEAEADMLNRNIRQLEEAAYNAAHGFTIGP